MYSGKETHHIAGSEETAWEEDFWKLAKVWTQRPLPAPLEVAY
tara:strand:- start:858 stop:986 length:129 start_codon:yes stop_codon:yes gene_type:complete